MKSINKIALGGGCHWCTEAVFQSIKGVVKVEQGFVEQDGADSSFSEAIIVTYDSNFLQLKHLIEIHLHTHQSTANHSMRKKYRSAIYAFNAIDFERCTLILDALQADFYQKLITQVYLFKKFKPSAEQFQNYYYSNPTKPFCDTYIKPKLSLLQKEFPEIIDVEKINPNTNREFV